MPQLPHHKIPSSLPAALAVFAAKGPAARQYLQDVRRDHTNSWGKHPIPAWSTRPAWKLEMLLSMDLGKQMDPAERLDNLDQVRKAALRDNTSLSVYELLRVQGLPPLTEKQASQEGAHALDSARHRSIQAIYADQPGVIINAITRSPGIGALKAVGAFLKKGSPSSIQVLDLLNQWGAQWEMPAIANLAQSLGLEKREEWDQMRRRLLAGRMEGTLAQPEPDSPTRLRI